MTNHKIPEKQSADDIMARLQRSDGDERELLSALAIAVIPIIKYRTKRILTDHQLSEDAAQETLLKIAKSWKTYKAAKAKNGVIGWVSVIADRMALTYRKQKQHKIMHRIDDSEEVINAYPEREVQNSPMDIAYKKMALVSALDSLTGKFAPQTIAAFRQIMLEEQSPQEAASNLQMTVGAVHVAKSRILSRLREMLAGEKER